MLGKFFHKCHRAAHRPTRFTHRRHRGNEGYFLTLHQLASGGLKGDLRQRMIAADARLAWLVVFITCIDRLELVHPGGPVIQRQCCPPTVDCHRAENRIAIAKSHCSQRRVAAE